MSETEENLTDLDTDQSDERCAEMLIRVFASRSYEARMNDLASFQGTWTFLSLEVDGNTLPAHTFAVARIIVTGNAFTTITTEATYAGVIEVGVYGERKTIDLRCDAGPERGKTSLGIYELDGDEWRSCLGLAGRDRPTEVLTTNGSGHALEALRRVS